MTEPESRGNAPSEGRDRRGRFSPGNTLGIPFGPDNPPPRSPGRPKKNAWIKELEQRLEEKPELRQALADVLLKTALKGSERARLKALDMIEDRVGGPVTQRVEDVTDHSCAPRRIFVVQTGGVMPELPEEVRAIEEARGRAEDGLPPACDSAQK